MQHSTQERPREPIFHREDVTLSIRIQPLGLHVLRTATARTTSDDILFGSGFAGAIFRLGVTCERFHITAGNAGRTNDTVNGTKI
jgi:hypothetical protein